MGRGVGVLRGIEGLNDEFGETPCPHMHSLVLPSRTFTNSMHIFETLRSLVF